jgi:hypothetical protein
MTKSEAITAIYTLFNAPHNADINIVYLNKVLYDLCKSHPEQEEWPEEPVGHMAGGVRPSQRTWVGLTDDEKKDWIDAMPHPPQPRHFMVLVNAIESELKEKNT